MNQILEKIERLGKVVAHSGGEDVVLDVTINKMLQREINKLKLQIEKFNHQLLQFEKKYNLDSVLFEKQFINGSLGDDFDFMEWISTIEMKRKAEEYVINLQG
jgi:hypothetical protein